MSASVHSLIGQILNPRPAPLSVAPASASRPAPEPLSVLIGRVIGAPGAPAATPPPERPRQAGILR